MIKKSNSDEIDLLDILQIIWEKKKIVIFIIVLSVIVAIIMQSLAPPVKIKASTEIRPIGIIEENRYEIYNSTLISVGPSGDLDIIDKSRVTVEGTQKIVELKDIVFQIKQKELEKIRINNINKMLLFELFVDTISQRINLVNAIKKFNFIKEENYSTKIEYDDAINELVSSIKLIDLKNLDFTNDNLNLKIEFEAFNVENWEDFLKFLEEEMNKKVRLKLFEAFNDYKSYVNIITEYNIEDIKSALLLTEDEQKKIFLNNKLNSLKTNKYAARLTDVFNSSPIANEENFNAAKISYDSTIYVLTTKKKSMKLTISLYILIGTILGIFFVLILNAMQKRR